MNRAACDKDINDRNAWTSALSGIRLPRELQFCATSLSKEIGDMRQEEGDRRLKRCAGGADECGEPVYIIYNNLGGRSK